MSDLVKGILIGGAIMGIVVGSFIPFGDKNQSLFDKAFKKDEV